MIPAIPRLGQIIGIAAAVVILGLSLALWKVSGERDSLKNWQESIVEVTSNAAGVKDKKGRPALLAPDQVAMQIGNLGLAVGDLKNSLAIKNLESERRAAELARQTRAAAEEQARFARLSAANDASIARLKALAQRPPSGLCKANPELLRELEGL